MNKNNILRRINWTNTLFLLITPIIGVAGTVFLVANGMLQIPTLILAFVWLMVSGLAITAGYHRLMSHRTYRAHPIVRIFFLLFGAAAFEGSALEWSTDHRNHHRYTDTDKDPYNINKGFWYAHIGWLFTLDTSRRDYSNVEDLASDKWIKLQHKYFVPIASVVGFVIPALIAWLWNDPIGGLIIAGVMRMVLNHHFTFCINSVCHIFGDRSYSKEQTGRDNWITAIFTYGEGFHNYHHQFPLDYRNGIRFYHYDPAKWLIRALNFFDLAHDLKKIGAGHITRYRLRTDEHFLSLKFKQSSEAFVIYVNEHLAPVRNRILQLISHIESIQKSGKIGESYHQLKIAHLELKHSLIVWGRLIKASPGR